MGRVSIDGKGQACPVRHGNDSKSVGQPRHAVPCGERIGLLGEKERKAPVSGPQSQPRVADSGRMAAPGPDEADPYGSEPSGSLKGFDRIDEGNGAVVPIKRTDKDDISSH